MQPASTVSLVTEHSPLCWRSHHSGKASLNASLRNAQLGAAALQPSSSPCQSVQSTGVVATQVFGAPAVKVHAPAAVHATRSAFAAAHASGTLAAASQMPSTDSGFVKSRKSGVGSSSFQSFVHCMPRASQRRGGGGGEHLSDR